MARFCGRLEVLRSSWFSGAVFDRLIDGSRLDGHSSTRLSIEQDRGPFGRDLLLIAGAEGDLLGFNLEDTKLGSLVLGLALLSQGPSASRGRARREATS